MTCTHLRQLFQLCREHDMKIAGSDLVRVVCNQCGVQEVCPSTWADEYDAKHGPDEVDPDEPTHAAGDTQPLADSDTELR